MLLVFKKAASEEVYCALYARLLAEISTRYAVILEEMHTLQDNYLEIFEEIEEVPEGGDNYSAFVEKNTEKRYRQGYSQFLAELAALEILDISNLEQTFRKLMNLMTKYAGLVNNKTLVEEYADCLARMSRVLKKKASPFFTTARGTLLNISKPFIEAFLEKRELYPSLSPKARFILMDVRDNLTSSS
jgi:glutamine synthetase adenylyltransferase